MRRRTGSRTLTIYNVSLDDAYEIIRKAFEEKDSGENEPIVEVCNIQITHKKGAEDGPEGN